MKFKKKKNKVEISLNNDEQITFFQGLSNFDVAKKNWGFYLTPSLQARCLRSGYKALLVKKSKKINIIFLKKNKNIKELENFFTMRGSKISEIYTKKKFINFFK